GPTQKMPSTATALDFFQLFVPDNCIQNMVVQTNMYAKKFQERFGSDEGWRPVTAEEMKAFLGFVTSTSVHRCESVLSIWSSGFFGNRSIALKMSQSRFEKILKYFHIVAFRPSQGSNQGLYKIQPFLDSLQQSFGCTFRPSQTQVLHEPLIDEDPVFITTCTERELRKRKKRKFSLWVRQCTSTGFICQPLAPSALSLCGPGKQMEPRLRLNPLLPATLVSVHLKEGQGSDGLAALKNKPQLHSLVAKQLCQNISGQNTIVFTGPSMTSLSLFSQFSKQGIFCCGLLSTRKSDCTGLPQSMLVCGSAPAQRGQWRIMMKGSLSLISWYNKGHFRFLTNGYSPTKQGGCCSGGRGGAGRRAWRSPRVCCHRRDHQEEERGDPVSAGRGGLRRPPQLHLQIRRQVQQVLYLPQTQQDVAAGLLAEHQHRHQQRLHPLQDVRRLRRQTPQPGAVWRDAGPRAAGPGPGLSHAVRRGRRRSRSRSRSRRRSRRTL
ncbi:unnamed protein product, partial [Tetraodon nigroviridis]